MCRVFPPQTCSRLLLKPELIDKFVKEARRTNKDYLKKKVAYKKVNELCKKVRT